MPFEPIHLSGSGSSVRRFSIPANEAAIADITSSGPASFTMWTTGADGTRQDLLVKVVGRYSGTVLFDVFHHSVAFDVKSSGSWTITVRPWSQAIAWDNWTDVGGLGDDVVQLIPPAAGFTTVTITHQGSSRFVVWGYSFSGRGLLVNEIGNYRGETALAYGTFLLEVLADGDWTVGPPT